MGLFKSKKKTITNTSVSRMVEDEDFIPSNKMAVLDYTMSQNSSSIRLSSESLSDYLIRATTNNIVARARRTRKYAERPSYAYGLPKSSMVLEEGVDVKEAVTEVLTSIYPDGVLVKDAYFGPMNNFYFLRPLLQQKYGYNYDTNELVDESARIGFPCYMESAQIIYSQYTTDALIDPDTLMQYGESAEAGYTPFRAANPKATHVPWVSNGTLDHDIARVTVVYKDASNAKCTYTIDLNYLEYEASSKPPSTGLDESDTTNIEPDAQAASVTPTLDGAEYYQANYEYTVNGVTHKDTFIYLYGSGLNTKLENLFTYGDPFGEHVPRIYARLDGKKLNAEELEDTPEYKSMVNICKNFGLNWSNWVDEIHKAVGSVSKVRQIYMTYSLPANTTDPLIQDYLFSYFETLYGKLPNVAAKTNYGDLEREYIQAGAKNGQSYEIKDNKYVQRIRFDAIGYLDIAGSIGPVGTTQSGRLDRAINLGLVNGPSPFKPVATVGVHYYRKQLTAATYREYLVYGLAVDEMIKGGYRTTAAGNDEELLLPIDLSIDAGFSMRQLEELYTKSMYIVLNTLEVVKVKWYKTGFFKAIMMIAATLVSYFFPPAGAAAWTWIAAVYAVIQTVVIGLLVQVAVKLLVRLGIDVGATAAIIAIVAVFYGGYLAITKTTSIAGVTASQVLQIGSQSFNMSSQGYALQTQEAIKDFNSVMADLSKEEAELQKQAKELGLGQQGPLLMFEPPLSIGVRMGEAPDDYFERSIHVSNLGTAVYSLIEMNVEMGVQLPSTYAMLNSLKETQDGLPIIRL